MEAKATDLLQIIGEYEVTNRLLKARVAELEAYGNDMAERLAASIDARSEMEHRVAELEAGFDVNARLEAEIAGLREANEMLRTATDDLLEMKPVRLPVLVRVDENRDEGAAS